ncbi:MAG: thiosulfate oxidation carrier protein SoxY [Pseudomonadota bacterium]|nr:thiosulfate oxidation carrier protein SoxY [Pseudomonadota bacterium]
MKRRIFLKGSLATGVLAIAAGAGILKPVRVLAAEWPAAAFDAEDAATALKTYFGGDNATDSDEVKIKAPVQAENGAVVPIKIETTAADLESIAVVVEGNPRPLVLSLDIGEGVGGYLSGRVKMGKTSNLVAYVKSGGNLLRASQEIKVTVGGCGG